MQKNKVNASLSCWTKLLLGVLQGSAPGLLFLLFFNWDSLHARLNRHYKACSYKTGVQLHYTEQPLPDIELREKEVQKD